MSSAAVFNFNIAAGTASSDVLIDGQSVAVFTFSVDTQRVTAPARNPLEIQVLEDFRLSVMDLLLWLAQLHPPRFTLLETKTAVNTKTIQKKSAPKSIEFSYEQGTNKVSGNWKQANGHVHMNARSALNMTPSDFQDMLSFLRTVLREIDQY